MALLSSQVANPFRLGTGPLRDGNLWSSSSYLGCRLPTSAQLPFSVKQRPTGVRAGSKKHANKKAKKQKAPAKAGAEGDEEAKNGAPIEESSNGRSTAVGREATQVVPISQLKKVRVCWGNLTAILYCAQ
jgi:hypothetical protein